MKLYRSATSPYARKVRVLLAEKGLACELVVVDTHAADSPVPAHNPLGLVPTLVRDDGSALFDSPVIVEYLDSLKGPALIPVAGEARWQVLRWAALADGVLDQAVGRTMELRRPPAERAVPAGAYLAEGRLTLADIALGVALDYIDLRYPHDWRARHPGLTAWHAGVAARPAFVATRPPASA